MRRPNYLVGEIDQDAIEHNCVQLRSLTSPPHRLCVTVKANAYGHGIQAVLPALQRANVDMLAVASIGEAQQLRQLGWSRPILLLGSELNIYRGALKRKLARWLVKHDVRVSITREDEIDDLAEAGDFYFKHARVHAMLDTGMSRMGLDEEALLPLIERVSTEDSVELEGLYTHFATADEGESSFFEEQLSRFTAFLATLRERDISIPILHANNSSAVLKSPGSCFDMIRPGLAVYGYYASESIERRLSLEPCLRLLSCLTFVKRIRAGSTIGYGRSCRAERDMTIGIVPIGYGDGYPRELGNRATMKVAGKWVPVLGRVSMDLTILDLSGLYDEGKTVEIGEEVVVIDNDPFSENSVERLAALTGTIPYAITAGLGRRITRIGITREGPDWPNDTLRQFIDQNQDEQGRNAIETPGEPTEQG